MRSVAPALLPIFRSEHQAGLLSRLFLGDAEIPMTDLARDLKIPLTTLHREVERLEEAGLLTSRRVGRTRLLRANSRHPAARPLTELLTVTFGPAQVVAEEFAELGADRIIIFGSWARRLAGERGRFPNDVDVLVIGDHSLHSAACRAADAAQSRLGLEVNTSHRTLADWEGTSSDALVADIHECPFVQVLPNAEEPVRDTGPAPSRLIYQLRPSWRPRFEPDVFVPADLNLLSGPSSGTIDPPVNLYWQPGELDFSDPGDLRRFYASALTKASTADQLSTWINRRALTDNWASIALPSRVRAAWETIHPQLRDREVNVNPRLRIQDEVLTAIADLGFALAGGSALIDYDVVTRDSEDIDAFLNRLDADAFTRAASAVIETCSRNGWSTELVHDQDLDKQILVSVPGDGQTVVQLVYHQRSTDPEARAGGGLRLIFEDVVGGKAAALADVARGRDFDDIAHVVETRGWSLDKVAQVLSNLGYPDRVGSFWRNIERFRRGEFDGEIRQAGFDPAFSHRILDGE